MKYDTQRIIMGLIAVAALVALFFGFSDWGIVLMLLAIVVKPDPKPAPANPVYVMRQKEQVQESTK